MKPKFLSRDSRFHPVAFWKKLVIILIVIAMPLFFSFYRNYQTQQALNKTQASDTKNVP